MSTPLQNATVAGLRHFVFSGLDIDYSDRDTTNVACRERVSADVGGRERCVVDRVVGSLVSVTPDRAATVVDADGDRSASGVAERD